MRAQKLETRIVHWVSKTIISRLFLEAMSLVKPHVHKPRRARVSASEAGMGGSDLRIATGLSAF
jgi:hypothetical protein